MADRREKWVHVKVTEAEREDWQAKAKAAGLTLADLLRQQIGAAKNVGRYPTIRRRDTHRADPLLLQNIGRVGSNLNQIARWANIYKEAAEASQIIIALIAIEQILLTRLPATQKKETDNVS